MNTPKEEAKKLFESMPDEMKRQSLDAMLALMQVQSRKEVKMLCDSLPKEAMKFVALMGLAHAEESMLESKKEKLKKEALPIREDALKILQSLITAHPEAEDLALVERSIAMAQRLHDAF